MAPLSAAVLTWDPADTSNGATIDAGSGTWDLSASNPAWNNGAANVAWSQTSATVGIDSAIFAGADAQEGVTYTVNVATSIAAAPGPVTPFPALVFSSNGYVLTAAEGSAPVITGRGISIAAGKTATLSGPLTLAFNVGGATQLSGYGTLIARDGAKINPVGNPVLGLGSKLRLQTGSVYTSGGSVIMGGQTTDGSTTELTVEGGAFNISGSGVSLILANVNSTTGLFSNTVVTLSSGSITNNSAAAGIRFGGATATATNNGNVNGTFNLDGGVLTAGRIFESNGLVSTNYNSTFNFNGGTLKALATTQNGATFMQTLNTANVRAGGAVIDTSGVPITIGQALLADPVSTGGGLTKIGAGTLTLTGANTYTGPTLVSEGTLAVAAASFAPSAITVAPGARLQTIAGAAAPAVPALTLENGADATLDLGLYDASNAATPSFGTFDSAGDYQVNLTGTNVPVGSFTVFSFGAKTGTGNPTVGSMPPGVTATVAEVGGNLVLNVLTPQLLNYIWSVGSGTWDTSTVNWSGLSYGEGSVVTFPNLAGDHIVTLSAPRAPFGTTVQNTLPNTYTFTGSPIGGSGGLALTGTGIVTLASANTYAGPTTVSSGVVLVGANNALGSTAGNTTISNGASLGLTGGVNYASAEPLLLTGSGYETTVGALVRLRGALQSVSGHSTYAGPISLGAGGARFGVQSADGASLTLSGTISPASGVTDSGVYFRAGNNPGNYIILTGSNNHWNTTTLIYSNVSGGTSGVRLGVNNALPTTASVVAGGNFTSLGTTLDLNGFNQTLPGLVESDGHLQIANLAAGTTSTLTLDTSLADYSSVPGINNLVTRAFTIIADGEGTTAVVKKGSFKQTIDGIQAYSGPTTIEAGTLAFVGIGLLQATPMTMFAGTTLDISEIGSPAEPRTEFALSGGLTGSGTINATEKTLTVSTTFAPGALAVTGNLTLTPGTATTLAVSDSPATRTALTVSGNLALEGSVALMPAAGFALGTVNSVTLFSAGSMTGTFSSVSVGGVALSSATPGVWTGADGSLSFTFTEASGTLQVAGGVGPNPLQAWRDTYFPNEGNDGTGIGADDADPDGDGVANLIEYATNTSPIAANPSAVVVGKIGNRLSLNFPRIDDPALRYTVEATNDLAGGVWTNVTPLAPATNNPTFGFEGSNPVATETVSETVVDSVEVLSPTTKRFLRLAIDVTP